MFTAVYFTSRPKPSLHRTAPSSSSIKLHLEYLNEGGANFVFRIAPSSAEQEVPSELRGQLLRLRKDLPHVQSAREQLTAFDEQFKPLFPAENLLQQTPIELAEGLLDLLNDALKVINRPAHRLEDVLPVDETHGLLVTDMTPAPGDVLLQMKPKWLTQSPNAPANARRCRTCALRAQRASKKVRTATDAQESCPLEIISADSSDREHAAKNISNDEELQSYLISEAQPLLHTLRSNQDKLDQRGILGTNDNADDIMDLCKAMTLRDCTLFLLKSTSSWHAGIEARLADLDLKQPEKLPRWKEVERELVDSDWYTNSETKDAWREERICLLSRNRTAE